MSDIKSALDLVGQALVNVIRQKLKQNNSNRTGKLSAGYTYDVQQKPNGGWEILILDTTPQAKKYGGVGQLVDQGHKTRLGTGKVRSKIHTKAFTTPKPFLGPAVSQVLNSNNRELQQATRIMAEEAVKPIIYQQFKK